MDSFIKLLEGETILLELKYKSCCRVEFVYLTNKRVIEYEKSACCGKDEELYCTYLKDILEFNYFIDPLWFCCCLLYSKGIVFQTALSKRYINIGNAEDLPKIAAVFTQAIDNAHREA